VEITECQHNVQNTSSKMEGPCVGDESQIGIIASRQDSIHTMDGISGGNVCVPCVKRYLITGAGKLSGPRLVPLVQKNMPIVRLFQNGREPCKKEVERKDE